MISDKIGNIAEFAVLQQQMAGSTLICLNHLDLVFEEFLDQPVFAYIT